MDATATEARPPPPRCDRKGRNSLGRHTFPTALPHALQVRRPFALAIQATRAIWIEMETASDANSDRDLYVGARCVRAFSGPDAGRNCRARIPKTGHCASS